MCHRVLGKEAAGNMHSCPECLKIKDLKVPWDINAAAKCKVEILPEEEEEEVYDYGHQERKRKRPRARAPKVRLDRLSD